MTTGNASDPVCYHRAVVIKAHTVGGGPIYVQAVRETYGHSVWVTGDNVDGDESNHFLSQYYTGGRSREDAIEHAVALVKHLGQQFESELRAHGKEYAPDLKVAFKVRLSVEPVEFPEFEIDRAVC